MEPLQPPKAAVAASQTKKWKIQIRNGMYTVRMPKQLNCEKRYSFPGLKRWEIEDGNQEMATTMPINSICCMSLLKLMPFLGNYI